MKARPMTQAEFTQWVIDTWNAAQEKAWADPVEPAPEDTEENE